VMMMVLMRVMTLMMMMMVRLMMFVMTLHGGDGEALWCMMYDVDV
jgi:hypothetical protein